MDTPAYESIIRFCVDQHDKFDALAWKRRARADAKLIAVTAKYLSMTSWFGHEEQLERIVVDIDAALADSAEFHREMEAIGFDLALFSASVRYGLAARKLPLLRPLAMRGSVAQASA